MTGYTVCCPESPVTVFEDRREIGPTYFFAPPRVFENMLTQMSVRMDDAGPLKRGLYSYFMNVARRSGERLLNGQSIGLKDRALYGLGRALVYGPLRNRMGFSKLRVAYTAGEAIGPEIFSYYRSLGINLKQLYGQTEAGVYVTAQPDGEIYSDTVGKPVPGVEVKIADNGEVLYRSPAQFHSYYKNEAATLATKTADGWVHTGDAGFFDTRGHLKIIDRAKDVGKLRDGGAVCAEIHREQAEVLSQHQGGRRRRPGSRLRHRDDQHRAGIRRQLGRAQRHRLCQLSGVGRASQRSSNSFAVTSTRSMRAWRKSPEWGPRKSGAS